MNLATELLVLFWLTYSVILVSVNEKCDLVQLLALTASCSNTEPVSRSMSFYDFSYFSQCFISKSQVLWYDGLIAEMCCCLNSGWSYDVLSL